MSGAGSARTGKVRIVPYSGLGPVVTASQLALNKGRCMNRRVGEARIGQWYLRWDKGEVFQVTACDERSGTIETQSFDGEIDEIDKESWITLPLGLAEPPEDWTGPVDDVEVDDLGYSETDMKGRDWAAPLEPFRAPQEAWQTVEDGEDAPEIEGLPAEDLVVDNIAARDLAGHRGRT